MPGPPAGHHEDGVEQLHRIEQAEGDREQHHRRELRQRDVAEGMPAADAVELGRLIEVRRDRTSIPRAG